jgi:hypothetical protein
LTFFTGFIERILDHELENALDQMFREGIQHRHQVRNNYIPSSVPCQYIGLVDQRKIAAFARQKPGVRIPPSPPFFWLSSFHHLFVKNTLDDSNNNLKHCCPNSIDGMKR